MDNGVEFDGKKSYGTHLNHNIGSINTISISFWVKQHTTSKSHRGPFWISDASKKFVFLDVRVLPTLARSFAR